MEDPLIDFKYVSTEKDFLEASALVPAIKKALLEAEDKETRLALVYSLGEQIVHIQSYLYQLTLYECIDFAEWISTYFALNKEKKIVESLEKTYKLSLGLDNEESK